MSSAGESASELPVRGSVAAVTVPRVKAAAPDSVRIPYGETSGALADSSRPWMRTSAKLTVWTSAPAGVVATTRSWAMKFLYWFTKT
jgi:hypothetical protein